MVTPDLYIEVLHFLRGCGGTYSCIDPPTAGDVLFCLMHDQYYLERNETGDIVTFCSYWLIDPGDLEKVRNGDPPDEKCGGSFFFVVDCGNLGGSRGLRKMIRFLRERHGTKGVAWNSRAFGNFKHFPNQKGALYGKEQ